MSISDWSDLDMNLDEIQEDASIRIVKSSTALQFISGIKPNTQEAKEDLSFKYDQTLRLSTSYSPIISNKEAKTPVNFQINTKIVDIFDDLSPKKKNDINERCFKFKEKVRAKVEKMTKDLEESEKKDCPFRPQLLTTTKNIRKFEEFLKEMKKFDRGKEKKFIDLRSKNRKESGVNRPPVICKNSEKIMRKSTHPLPVYQKLYDQGRILKKKPEKKNEILSFSPTVNPKSHEIKRTLTVDQILYNDALRRNNKRSNSPSFIKEKFISPSSEQVLTEKFINEFYKTLDFLYPKEKSLFNFTDFITILCELSFIHNDIDDKFYSFEKDLVSKAWSKVENDFEASKEKILEFLLAVLNYEHSSAENKIKSIHREFISFYECRHWFVLNEKRNREQREHRELTFTPSLFSGYSCSPNDVSRKSWVKAKDLTGLGNERILKKGKVEVENKKIVMNRRSASIVEMINKEIAEMADKEVCFN